MVARARSRSAGSREPEGQRASETRKKSRMSPTCAGDTSVPRALSSGEASPSRATSVLAVFYRRLHCAPAARQPAQESHFGRNRLSSAPFDPVRRHPLDLDAFWRSTRDVGAPTRRRLASIQGSAAFCAHSTRRVISMLRLYPPFRNLRVCTGLYVY